MAAILSLDVVDENQKIVAQRVDFWGESG